MRRTATQSTADTACVDRILLHQHLHGASTSPANAYQNQHKSLIFMVGPPGVEPGTNGL